MDLDASKLSLSSISSEELWTKSGRLTGAETEVCFLPKADSLLTLLQLFRFRDRRDAGYLLAPTHEEEITTLVSSTTNSYRELPLRLYQICK